jgi:hypothetical protein
VALATINAPGWELIDSNTSPGTVAAVNFNHALIPAFTELMITVESITASTNAAVRFQFSTDGGSTFLNIAYQRNQNSSGSEQRQTYLGHESAGSSSLQGTCHIICPPNAYKHARMHSSQSGASNFGGAAHGTVESASVINYVRITLNTGNITAGTFRLFGKR